MIQRLKDLLARDRSFAFETTAAGTNYLKYLKEAESKNYQINLMFLWLSSPELAIKRVAQRVAKGGHHIPDDTVRRRYKLGLKNLMKHYLPLSHTALILDNSGELQETIARKNKENGLEIHNEGTWREMRRIADD